MVIDKVLGNIADRNIDEFEIDNVYIDWYEVEKKILHKSSEHGMEVGIRNSSTVPLKDGDILVEEGHKIVVLKISDCDCIAIKPQTMIEMGKACYEMGNRHAPLFEDGKNLLTPFDEPLMKALSKCGFNVEKRRAKLITPFGGRPHGHSHSHDHGDGDTHEHNHDQGHGHSHVH